MSEPAKKKAKSAAVKKAAHLHGDWLVELLKSAKAVAATAKKLDFYRDARREPPESLAAALIEQETALDNQVKAMLLERENLKRDVLEDSRFGEEALREIEFSYQKAVCFARGKKRAFSRMFFLPCIYYSKEDGSTESVIEFTGAKRQTFAEFVSSFLDEHFGEESNSTPHVSIYSQSLKDWNVQDEEEKMLPALHQAILEGIEVDMDVHFPARARALAESDGAGWSVAVLPFAVEHDDEAWLESISFEGYEGDFVEEFEEIFDPSSKLDYQVPCDPTIMQDEAVRHLWSKQLDLTIEEMAAIKKPKQLGLVETTFVWEDGAFVGVVMNFRVVEQDRSGDDDEDDGVIFHRQMTRQTLIGETPGALSAYLVEYPPLMRADFDLIFGHESQSAD